MKNFAVIGCGRFGRAVAKTLYKLGYDVLAVDIDKDVIQQISEDVTRAVTAEVDEEVFRKIGVGECDVAVVSIGSNVEHSVIATLIIKELGVPYIVCKAGNDIQEKILYKIGADKVIMPEREMGEKIAKNLVTKNFLDKINLDPEYSMGELNVPQSWIGKSIAELDVRKNYNINILAIRRKDYLDTVPEAALIFREGWKMIIVGKNDDLDRMGEI